jgi:PAS domain S-box-containing protein
MTTTPKSRRRKRKMATGAPHAGRHWERAQRLARLGAWDWDQQTNRLRLSEGALRLFGFGDGAAEQQFEEWLQRIHPDDRERIGAEHRAAQPSYERTYRILDRDGAVHQIHEHVEPLVDSSGRLVGTTAIAQDVTQWHDAQRALRDSEARWQSFMDHAPVGISVKDLDGRFVTVNSAVAGYFGRPAPEIVGRRTGDLSHSTGAADVMAMDRETVASGRAVTREVHFTDRSSGAWTYEVKFPIFDQAGRMTAIGGFAIDISELKKAERARQQTEALLSAFMDHAPFEMVVKDLEGRYLMVNNGMATAWSMPTGSFIGRRLPEIRPTPGVDIVEAMDREVIATGESATREIHYSEWPGCWSRAIKFPIRDLDGRIVAIGGISLDISEGKRAERELIEAKELAVSANQAKSMFLANMSHELRTPLNAIIGFADIIARQLYGPISSERYPQYAADITDSAQHLLGIVNSILDTTKIEAGKFELTEEPCSIAGVVDSAIRMTAERADGKSIAIEQRIAPGLSRVRADERALRQILINLLFNAVKFTPSYGRVTVAADVGQEGGLRIRVTDTGVGIASGDIAKVFDRFTQIGDAYTRLQGGTGLGLHVTRKLVELHQGTIGVESALGSGTAVTVSLPAWRWCETLGAD